MYKAMFAALLAAGLIAVPLPQLTQPAVAQYAPSAAQATPATPAKTDAKPKKAPSPGQAAMRERQKKCGAEWKEAKAAGKIEKGMKWPQYWSACNKRLKSAS